MIHVKIRDSLFEIDEPQFFKVDPLIQGVSTHLSLPTIVKGKSSGRIWVDSPSDPDIALIWDLVNGFLFIRKKPARSIDSSEVNRRCLVCV